MDIYTLQILPESEAISALVMIMSNQLCKLRLVYLSSLRSRWKKTATWGFIVSLLSGRITHVKCVCKEEKKVGRGHLAVYITPRTLATSIISTLTMNTIRVFTSKN